MVVVNEDDFGRFELKNNGLMIATSTHPDPLIRKALKNKRITESEAEELRKKLGLK